MSFLRNPPEKFEYHKKNKIINFTIILDHHTGGFNILIKKIYLISHNNY